MTSEVMVQLAVQRHRRCMLEHLAHRTFGSGPDLVFLHGWPLHGETWRAVVAHLAPRFTCHVLDLPGTGKSTWDATTTITLPAHADRVIAAIDALGLSRFGFVAHDSGAAIARLVAARLGDRCFGLVLGNTEIPGYRPPGLVAMVKLAKLGAGKVVLGTLRSKLVRHSNLGFGGCFHDKRLIDGAFGELFVAPLLTDARVASGQLQLVKQLEWRVLDELPAAHRAITAPTLLIWGADDPWFPLARARGMVEQFAGGAQLVALRDAKLFVHEERPAEWTAHAAPFLAQHARAAA